ncbi:MAG: nitroreductase family protein [Candidatus Aenigmatarchaeota archaeon]|nr:MAG: nitroreductase family protein [Candidatus Aenigmarchaeota archaeon]
METKDCIRTRASVRDFRPDDIPRKDIDEILEAATAAPCAGNVQEWRFVVVKKMETKEKLAEAAFQQTLVKKAPVVIVVCSDLREIGDAYGERGQSLYSVQDTANATQNMILAAWDKGIGSCWIGSFNEKSVRDALVLPAHVRPLAILPLGYPASVPYKPGRKSLKEVVHEDFY